jgi:hypothetical protein
VNFGRKRTPLAEKIDDAEGREIVGEDAEEAVDDPEAELVDVDDEELEELEPSGDEDWRADGPFDYDEVELSGDQVTRIDLGTLIVTPWDGLGLQLQVDEQTRQVRSVTGVWHDSGIELSLYAAPASGGLADDLRAEAVEEATQAGGSAEIVTGEFGPELRRVLPQTGPKGEQLFHVSRVWYAEGPKWLLRGTLLGEAALDPDAVEAAPFRELFRNLVVRRGSSPMVPGEPIAMTLPEGAA